MEVFLKQNLNLRLQKSNVITRTYLDTFDWRIFNEGGVLESTVDRIESWLTWRSLGAEQVYGRWPIEQIPRFVWDLKESNVKAKLEDILEFRALLPVVAVQSRIKLFSILNDQAKIVLHMEIQCDHFQYKSDNQKPSKRSSILGKRVQLFPMKGYKKELRGVCKLLQEEGNLVPASDDPLVTTLESFGIKPGDGIQKTIVTAPDQRADVAVKDIFLQLLDTMEKNENGMRHDIDSEFLHDFRVAVRRTRSLLGQIRNVLPKHRIKRFKRDFAWLGEVTGPTRDMDVYLLMFDAYKLSLPSKMREDLMPLYEYLRRHKFAEHNRLIKVLDTLRYRKLKQDWKNFLTGEPRKHTTLAYANHSIITVASERIWSVYRKAYKQGNLIVTDSPATSLHELRKTCKKLRYLNEFFQKLYPENKIQKLIKNLKDLQDNLGEFQDLQVQQESLRKFILAMEQETGINSETRNAMETLVGKFARQNQRVRSNFDAWFRKFASSSNHLLYRKIIASRRNSHNG